METPLSSRRRAPKWLQPTRRLDITPDTCHSTDESPDTPSMRQSIDFDEYDDEQFLPSTQGYGGGSGDEVFWNYEASPQSRAILNRQARERSGGKEKRTTKRRPPPKPTTPLMRLRSTHVKPPSLNDLHGDMDFLLLNQLSEAMRCEPEAKSTPQQSPCDKTAKTPDTTPLESPLNKSKDDTWGEDDPFGQDDSFLVQCSQAIDEDLTRQSKLSSMSSSSNSLDSNSNHTFKRPEMTAKKISTTKPSSMTSQNSILTSSNSTMTSQTSSNDAFDDDDSEEFEMLLSQIDIPKVPTPKRPSSFKQTIVTRQTVPATASRVVQPSGPPKPVLAPPQPPKPVLTQPSNSKVNTNLFKRFKSADDAALESRQQKCTAVSSAAAAATTTTAATLSNRPSDYGANSRVSTSFRRVNSVPETPPGPLPGGRQTTPTIVPKCSKEEIERKRQEALKKRQMNSQMTSQNTTRK